MNESERVVDSIRISRQFDTNAIDERYLHNETLFARSISMMLGI
jgi:hypothetical protein